MSDSKSENSQIDKSECCCIVEHGVHYFIEEKWENQRFRPPNWRVCPMRDTMFKDPPQWSSEDYKENRGHVYLPEKWSWVTDWERDFTDTDENGWKYATWFSYPFKGKHSVMSRARKRKWTRRRQYNGEPGGCKEVQICPEEVRFNFPETIKIGPMEKRTDDVFRVYTKRFCELKSDLQLFYYKDETNSKLNKGKSINLFDVIDVRVSSRREFGFEIETTSQIYYFRTDKQTTTDEWINDINTLCDTRLSKPRKYTKEDLENLINNSTEFDEKLQSNSLLTSEHFEIDKEDKQEIIETADDNNIDDHDDHDKGRRRNLITSESSNDESNESDCESSASESDSSQRRIINYRNVPRIRKPTKFVDVRHASGKSVTITPHSRKKRKSLSTTDALLVFAFIILFLFMVYQTYTIWHRFSEFSNNHINTAKNQNTQSEL